MLSSKPTYSSRLEYTIACSAKINWFLNVSTRRADGYHNLQTVMQRVNLYDRLVLRPRDDSLIECIDPAGSCNCNTADNIIFRAAALLQNYFNIHSGVSVTVTKNIPVGAGLGGGSSDAAAILSSLVAVWNLSPRTDELTALAVSLGADVPFFLGTPLALCTGIGEIMSPRDPYEHNLVLWKPAASLSTDSVYRQFDSMPRKEHTPESFLDAYARNDIHAIGRQAWNNLAEAACECLPELNDMMHRCRAAGAVAAWISGSGPTVVSLCSDEAAARDVYAALSAEAAPGDFLHCGKTLTG